MAVVERRMADGAIRRLLRVDDTLALVELQDHGTLEQPAIEAHVLASNGEIDPDALDAMIRRWLPREIDLTAFYATAQADALLWALIAPCIGLRNFRTVSPFEALTTTIIEQQIALVSAQRAERWLIETFGDALTHAGETYFAFPTPERIAALTIDDLRPLKITFRRMGAIIDIARTVASGELDFETLASDDRLTTIKGVGAWTAAWTTIRAHGVYPYMGSADVALRAAVNRYIDDQSGRADRPTTDALFARYGDHAGIAAFYTLMRYAFEKY